MRIAQILCPVDRSDVSRRAFDYAASLARWRNARLTVLEVIDVTPPAAATGIPELGPVPEGIPQGVRQALTDLAEPARAAGVQTDVRIEEGRVDEHILENASRLPADLIVMGTHGRSGVERLVLGSVTAKIVRRAACPVLTIPPGDAGTPSTTAAPFTTVLCPTDFSEASAAAVKLAADLADDAHATLLLLHVVEWPFGHTEGPDPVTALRLSLLGQAERDLAAVVPERQDRTARTETIAVVGNAARQIVATATDRAADLVVMGASGRGALDLAVLGSTTYRVLRDACCPVVTVRAGRTAPAAV